MPGEARPHTKASFRVISSRHVTVPTFKSSFSNVFEVFGPDLLQLQQRLLLPEGVVGTTAASDAGLENAVQLLPSFLHLLRRPDLE